MKRVVLVFLVFVFYNALAQVSPKDSKAKALEEQFAAAKSEKQKALLQMELSDYWSYRDTAKAFRHLDEAQRFIKQDEYLKGLSLFYKGGIYFDQNIEKAQQLYRKSDAILQHFETKEAYEFRAKLWHNFATLEQLKGSSQEFMEITLKKCIPFAQKSENKLLLSGYYVDMGLVFYNMKEFQKSIAYYQQAIEILQNEKNNNEAASWAYLNLANTYLELQQLEPLKQALNKADFYLKDIPESQYNSIAFIQKSKYYNAIGDKKQAYQNIRKGIAFSKEMNLDYDFITLNFELFRLLKEEKKYPEARNILLELLAEKKYSGNKKNRLMFLKQLSEVEKLMGNFESALQYKEQYIALNDSVQQENEKLEILNLESQYKSKDQQKSLAHLDYKNRQKSIIIGISAVLFAVSVIFFLYALKQRKQKNERALAAVELQRKNEIEKALYEGEAQERDRIAKDLHDGIGGRITGIKISLENLAQHNHSPELKQMSRQLEICLAELRNTARNLTPETLKKFGLEDAIKDFCQLLNTAECSISCYTKNLDQCTDLKQQVNIFHLIQETVSNAVKHSGATKILVQCTIENQLLMIDIEDNGKGFSVPLVARNLGLNNIEKRVFALNGKLDIQSTPGKGTVVSIEANV